MKMINTLSAKRVISLCIALALIITSLFTVNIGVNINADATDEAYVYDTWEYIGDVLYDTNFEDGSGTQNDPYIIATCEQLYAVTSNRVTTNGVYFKVKDGVDAFYMQATNWKEKLDAVNTAEEVKAMFEANDPRIYWSKGTFQGFFDGNGATVYGLCTGLNGDQTTFGLFHWIDGGSVKNVSVMKSYANCSGFTGAIIGGGLWGTVYSTTVENCTVAHNYLNSSNYTGAIVGHAANDPITVKNCLVYDNLGSISQIIGHTDATSGNTVEDTVAIDVKIAIGNICTYTDCYTNQSMSQTGVTVLPVDSMTGVMAQINMSGLDWATDTEDGFWYVSQSGYPSNQRPDNWVYIAPPDIWDKSTATSFESGSGTKDDPYIIKTPEQLRKMVLEGGRIDTGKTKEFNNNGTIVNIKVYEKGYYKVADGVSDIYLNAVYGGDVTTIKALADAELATNWTAGLFDDASFKADTDGDGLRDQATAFRGEFDGNGATIHGLYSKTVDRSWNNEGVGFVPALMDDAVIKNVTFDKAYVHNTGSTYAGVITASLGYDTMQVTNPDIDPTNSGGQKYNGELDAVTSVGIHNVTVRNSRVQTNSASGYGGVAGFVASHASPAALSFTNCLFDDSNELVIPDGASFSDVIAGVPSTGKAGFVILGQTSTDHFYLENCVSLGVYPDNKVNEKVKYVNCYTSETSNRDGLVGDISEYNVDTMPALNWTQWSVVDGKLAVTGNSAADSHATTWKDAIANCNEARWSLTYSASTNGNNTALGAYEDGVYINYENIIGSGTKDDPYLVSDAITLARVIGSGGTHYTEKLHFKLTNDINVGGLRWIDMEDYAVDANNDGQLDEAKYSYRPFAGEIDGNGYAVTNLFAIDSDITGLIPVLAGGTVKNLHVRGAFVSAYHAGAIVGEIDPEYGGTVTGCSAEDSTVVAEDMPDEMYIVGYHDDIINLDCGTIDDCYFTGENGTVYITDHNEEYGIVTPTVDELKNLIIAESSYKDIWYIGGTDDKTPKLVNRAKAMPCVDIDGDGDGYVYGSADLSSLKNKLLKKKAYANIQGDVTRNGSVNSSDLVALVRATIGDYNHAKDGFWRNVAEGNLAIYYGENDNYDAARKLELYLEAQVPGIDIIKNASGENTFVHTNDGTATPGAQFAIVVGNTGSYTTGLTDNNYGITYDNDNAVLWIQGANFTGVEQAVLDFIANSSSANGVVYTVDSATLSPEKQPKTIGETTYYYAWGDEFDVETTDSSIQKEVWNYGEMGNETTSGATSKYMNMETAEPTDFASLYEVNDGKLTIWRGINSNNYVEKDHSWGYKPVTLTTGSTTAWGGQIEADDKFASAGEITTERSMLFKQGYVEMKASLPNDGHSFPAWWLFGAPNGGQNRAYTTSLFSKVYKENPNWTGVNTINGAYPNSYKYQLPTAHLEFDIVELMQDISYVQEFNTDWDNFIGVGLQPETHLTGVDRTKFNLTIHKWYSENVENNTLYVIDWDKWFASRTAPTEYTLTDNGGEFNTSVSNNFITRWGKDMMDHDMSSLSNLAGEHVYGFKWVANETQNTFTVTLYVDGVQSITFDQSKEYYDSAEVAGGTYAKDSKTFNQYVYFLLDNHFYSANQNYKNGTTEYTDLLTYEDGDKTTFDIDYVRVYQEDGKRDIVTKETEAFNNGNHFGYGK